MYREMCHLFTVDLTLHRVKVKCWPLSPRMTIDVWFVSVHVLFSAGSPCSLLLSPLCEACPPLEGPGVPAECVEVASSWSLQEAGF